VEDGWLRPAEIATRFLVVICAPPYLTDAN
jgi:hypothetical protein